MVHKIVIGILSVLLLIVLGLLARSIWPEPSMETLQQRNDRQRVQDLSEIIDAAHTFRNQQNRLPATLEELAGNQRRLALNDPVSGERYEYELISADIYSLCAVFETSAADNAFGYLPGFNRHDIGHQCVYRTYEP